MRAVLQAVRNQIYLGSCGLFLFPFAKYKLTDVNCDLGYYYAIFTLVLQILIACLAREVRHTKRPEFCIDVQQLSELVLEDTLNLEICLGSGFRSQERREGLSQSDRQLAYIEGYKGFETRKALSHPAHCIHGTFKGSAKRHDATKLASGTGLRKGLSTCLPCPNWSMSSAFMAQQQEP